MATAAQRLVGREGELRRLEEVVRSAATGEPAFVLVLGEAGIGKTSLLRATEARARDAGLRVLAGTAIESGRGIPYLPLVAPLVAALDPKATDNATKFVRTALAARGTGDDAMRDGAPDGAPGFQPARLIEAMFEVLAGTPTLLSVDDVHWADESTVAVLDYLAHRATDVPLAVVCGARDDEPSLVNLLPLADGRRFAQLPVRRLTREETAEQAKHLGTTVSGRRLDALHGRTAGNPFFVEQALADGAAASVSDGASATPAALRALVTRRAARLSGDARAFVEAVAVLGRPVDQTLAADVAGLRVERARPALEAAVDAGIVVSGPNGIALRHPLFGEVVLEDLEAARRRELHRRAALGLEARGSDAAELAGHWWRAGDRDRTWRSSLAAAGAAAATHAFAEQHWHLEHAVEAWPGGELGRGRALLDAARAAWMSDDADAAVRFVRAAEQSDAPIVEVTVALGEYAWDSGDHATSIAAFERAAPMLDEIDDPGLRARALYGLGRGRVPTNPYDSIRLGLDAAEQAVLAGDRLEEAEAVTLTAMARAWTGTLAGIPELERSLAIALEIGASYSIGHAYQFLVELLTVGGEVERALEVAARGIEDCERVGVARVHGSDLRSDAARLLIERGRWNEVEALLAPADARANVGLARAILAIRRGDDAAADEALRDATTLGSIGGPGIRGGYVEVARAERAWLAGDVRAAIEELDRVVLVRGVWTDEVGAWVARWRARLAPESADPDAIRADIEASLDVEARPAMLAEVNAELAERRDRVDPHLKAQRTPSGCRGSVAGEDAADQHGDHTSDLTPEVGRGMGRDRELMDRADQRRRHSVGVRVGRNAAGLPLGVEVGREPPLEVAETTRMRSPGSTEMRAQRPTRPDEVDERRCAGGHGQRGVRQVVGDVAPANLLVKSADRLGKPLRTISDEGRQERVEVLEVAVEETLRRPGLGGDGATVEPIRSVAPKNALGGIEELPFNVRDGDSAR